jgi:cell division protein ZapA (FtsZ GTPase activity inhibitor)
MRMGMVDVTINGRRQQVQCGDGEEPRLRRLAQYVDGCAARLVQQHGQLPDGKVLLLTSLLIADELADALEDRTGQVLDRSRPLIERNAAIELREAGLARATAWLVDAYGG